MGLEQIHPSPSSVSHSAVSANPFTVPVPVSTAVSSSNTPLKVLCAAFWHPWVRQSTLRCTVLSNQESRMLSIKQWHYSNVILFFMTCGISLQLTFWFGGTRGVTLHLVLLKDVFCEVAGLFEKVQVL